MIHLLVYISTAAAAVLSIIQAGKQILPWIAGIVVYVLAAVLLTLSCVFFYHDLRENVIKKILEVIKKNPLGERFLADYTFRTILTTLPAFLINVAYTVYNGVIGIMNQSVWFITMAVYYSLLGIMRYRAVSTGRKISRLDDREQIRKKELSVIKTDGHSASGIESGAERRCTSDDRPGYGEKIFRDHGDIYSGIYLL